MKTIFIVYQEEGYKFTGEWEYKGDGYTKPVFEKTTTEKKVRWFTDCQEKDIKKEVKRAQEYINESMMDREHSQTIHIVIETE